MKKIKKVLCPVDFSEFSEETLEIAIQMAEKFESTFHLIYVLPKPNYYDWTLTGMSNLMVDNSFEKIKAEAQRIIMNKVDQINKKHPLLKPTYEINEKTDPIDGILEAAKTKKSDLIIMGSHGRRGLNRILMGSVAEAILRHAPCAVMIYKGKTSGKK